MTNSNRRSGKSTREMANKRYKSRVWLVVLLGGVVLLLLIAAWNASTLGIGGFGFLGFLILTRLVMDYMDVKTRKMIKEERRAIRGAKAEEKIGFILDQLGDNYFVIHDIVSAYGNIDHITLNAQGGIFLIETKAHGGRVSVVDGRLLLNGHDPEKDFIAQTLKNTYWLRDTIKSRLNVEPWITPVIVFTNAFVERTAPIKGVSIVNKKYLAGLLTKRVTKAANQAVWNNRELVYQVLHKD